MLTAQWPHTRERELSNACVSQYFYIFLNRRNFVKFQCSSIFFFWVYYTRWRIVPQWSLIRWEYNNSTYVNHSGLPKSMESIFDFVGLTHQGLVHSMAAYTLIVLILDSFKTVCMVLWSQATEPFLASFGLVIVIYCWFWSILLIRLNIWWDVLHIRDTRRYTDVIARPQINTSNPENVILLSIYPLCHIP